MKRKSEGLRRAVGAAGVYLAQGVRGKGRYGGKCVFPCPPTGGQAVPHMGPVCCNLHHEQALPAAPQPLPSKEELLRMIRATRASTV